MKPTIAVAVLTALALAGCGRAESPEKGATAEGEAALNLAGGNGADTLEGAGAADHLTGGPGADVLDGKSGFDYARYDTAAQGVIADLADPSRNTGDARGDSYASIEGLGGSPFNDELAGDDGVNDIDGGAGDDRLVGRGGDDGLGGGPGRDVYVGGDGDDTFRIRRGEGQGDRTEDFQGAGEDGGDVLVFVGYGPGATFTRAEGQTWQVRSGDGAISETITIAAGGDAIADGDYRFE